MADNYLITGYWGEPHVTVENDRSIHASIFGTGKFVLPLGEQFRAEYIGNNTIRMYDGKLMNNGAVAGIPFGEYVDLLISNAGQGMNRNDLIVFQYSKDTSTMVETGEFVVVQGVETSGTASDPALTSGDLLSADTLFDQMALWRVSVSGIAISAPELLFEVTTNLSTKSPVGHTHKADDITSTVPISKGGTGATTAAKALESIGAAPELHMHGNISAEGVIGTEAGLMIVTGANGILETADAETARENLGIPTPTAADSGKALVVGEDGTYALGEAQTSDIVTDIDPGAGVEVDYPEGAAIDVYE